MGIFRWATATRTRRIVSGIGILVAIPLLALGWWLGSPLFLNKTVNEEFPTNSTVVQDPQNGDENSQNVSNGAEGSSSVVSLKSGEFMDEDRLHRGSGTATIYNLGDDAHTLRLENFDVTNGPDLFVLLLKDPEGRDKDQGYVDLGRLKGNRGNQNYEIPFDIDPSEYNSVMIYCRAFSVIFSIAELDGLTA